MTTLNDVMDRVKELTKLIKSQPEVSVGPEVFQAAIVGLDKLIEAIRKTGPFTKKDMDAALSHEIGCDIIRYTSYDKERKAFFTVDYFKKKFDRLPKNRDRVAPFVKGIKASTYLNPLILYFHRLSSDKNSDGLKQFFDEIRSEYENSPPVKKQETARALFRKLMVVKDVNAITAELHRSFPTEEQIKEFAKTISMKIPAAARGKGALKKTIHERLADAIYKEGGVIRMELR